MRGENEGDRGCLTQFTHLSDQIPESGCRRDAAAVAEAAATFASRITSCLVFAHFIPNPGLDSHISPICSLIPDASVMFPDPC